MNSGKQHTFRSALLAVSLLAPLQVNAWWGPGPGYTNWGPFDGFGDMFGDLDFNFSFRTNMRGMFNGYGFSRPYYGYHYYAPVPVAYAPPVAPAAAPARAGIADGDVDGDGVIDASDLCPDTPAGAQVDAFGCEQDAAIVLRGVNFELDSDRLTKESLKILDGVATTLTANSDIRVQVAGHTDSQGENVYNKDLSQRRATSVVDYLISKGVASTNLVPMGYGEEQPIAGNASAAGRAQNRRVELVRIDG